VTATTDRAVAVTTPGPPWWFLGVVVEECPTSPRGPVASVATLPEGASPPLHVHADLDDSFYLLEGTMLVRCGDDIAIANAGSWVPFPSGVPHTFRVMDGPARVLMVHADDSFLAFVHDIGRPATVEDVPDAADGPAIDELDRVSTVHGITNLGPSMTDSEARQCLERLSPRSDPSVR